RYGWPLVWMGLRVEADLAARSPRRAGAGADQAGARVAALAAVAEALPLHTPSARACHALALVERDRVAGVLDEGRCAAAVSAARELADPHRLAYALLRFGEAAAAAGQRNAAVAALREAGDIAQALGAAPLAAAIAG